MNNKFFGWRTPQHHANSYVESINNILSNNENINNFRSNIDIGYSTILEHLNYNDGVRYYEEIKNKFPDKLDLIKKFALNDSVGNPVKYKYDNFEINPTTLRYCFVSMDILTTFSNLENINYVEIGGGYGGQARALSSIVNFNTIKMFDLPQALKLQTLYLNKFEIRPETYTIDENFEIFENSLIVSNYAWCELDKEYRQLYMNKIINNCKLGYLTVYDIDVFNEFEHLKASKNVQIKKDNFNGSYIVKIESLK